jgi:hypothetical protein
MSTACLGLASSAIRLVATVLPDWTTLHFIVGIALNSVRLSCSLPPDNNVDEVRGPMLRKTALMRSGMCFVSVLVEK